MNKDESSSTDEEGLLFLIFRTVLNKKDNFPEINIRSEKFNPLKALYSKKFKTEKNAKKFDNVAVSLDNKILVSFQFRLFQTFMSRLKKAGNSVHSDLDTNSRMIVQTEAKTEEKDADK